MNSGCYHTVPMIEFVESTIKDSFYPLWERNIVDSITQSIVKILSVGTTNIGQTVIYKELYFI